ncbi:unnamed protein product [Lactuca virosa]|uniref:Uncharacterized protein n=1 Tax=Lactuca virosa TaxID=75947 RepID=A0AAU9N8P0_9ASTR|nr:unnamed protein product [Lactuca virosa]
MKLDVVLEYQEVLFRGLWQRNRSCRRGWLMEVIVAVSGQVRVGFYITGGSQQLEGWNVFRFGSTSSVDSHEQQKRKQRHLDAYAFGADKVAADYLEKHDHDLIYTTRSYIKSSVGIHNRSRRIPSLLQLMITATTIAAAAYILIQHQQIERTNNLPSIALKLKTSVKPTCDDEQPQTVHKMFSHSFFNFKLLLIIGLICDMRNGQRKNHGWFKMWWRNQ